MPSAPELVDVLLGPPGHHEMAKVAMAEGLGKRGSCPGGDQVAAGGGWSLGWSDAG